MRPDILAKDEVYAIVGAAMEVYNTLGSGYLEPVYQEAMTWEMADRDIPAEPQRELRITYKNRVLLKGYVADFICYNRIIVELKAIEHLTRREEAQLLNYLKATGLEVGVLINFGSSEQLEWKRMVLTKK
jgi:GxxExxY protein